MISKNSSSISAASVLDMLVLMLCPLWTLVPLRKIAWIRSDNSGRIHCIALFPSSLGTSNTTLSDFVKHFCQWDVREKSAPTQEGSIGAMKEEGFV